MTDTIIVRELPSINNYKIGVVTLNKPTALNALDMDMASGLMAALTAWQNDDSIVAVVINGSGDKAFCAGGDVVSMYQAMQAQPQQIPDKVKSFFTLEYTLDYLIHTYSKPVIVWANGYVMGGGVGLLAGGSHRIATTTTKLAMPEITIGLYPDVGGSYFLPRMPGKSGLFLGLTGAMINATDAHYVGMADYIFDDHSLDLLLEKLQAHQWQATQLKQQVSHICEALVLPATQRPDSNLIPWQHTIDRACSGMVASAVVEDILAIDAGDDNFMRRAQQTLAAGSPITMQLVFQQCRKGAQLSLADCFRMELVMSCRCAEYGEFEEGVRAHLVDKDKQPQWRYKQVADVPCEDIIPFFTVPWAKHPLAKLEEQV